MQWVQNGQRNLGKKKKVGVCIILFQDRLQSCDEKDVDEQEIKEHPEAVKSWGFFPTNGSRTTVPPYLKRKERGREVENFGPSSYTMYK